MLTRVKKIASVSAVSLFLLAVAIVPVANAADTTDLTQIITSGTLATEIRDASRVAVPTPTFAITSAGFSFDCQTSTGTVGSNSQRVYVDNGDAADNGWTLTMAATGGVATVWENAGATQTFDFNDIGGSGCTDSGDADSRPGGMTVDANAGTLTADCGSCATTNITKGSSTAFNSGTTDSITLLTAAAGSNDIGRWYLTGVGISQTIPAEQTPDSYDINMTVTATAS